jgi:hypothetical protein
MAGSFKVDFIWIPPDSQMNWMAPDERRTQARNIGTRIFPSARSGADGAARAR